jgi:hypothetical protein
MSEALARDGLRGHPLVERIAYHLARVRAWARRVTVAGLAVRGVIWLSGAGALLLALPPASRLGPALPAVAVAALLPAAVPRTRWVSLLELAAAGLVAVTAGGQPVSVPALVLLGSLLYLHHTAAALGAQLRTDSVVPAVVFRHWGGRCAVVLAASAGLSLALATTTGRAPEWSATGYLAIGVLAALAVAVTLAVAASRADQGVVQPDPPDSGMDYS